MNPAFQELAIGRYGDPGINAIGAFRVTAFWTHGDRIEARLMLDGECYDHPGAIRIFDDREGFSEFLQGLREGKSPKPLRAEHNFLGAALASSFDGLWLPQEIKDEFASAVGLTLPKEIEWDDL